MKLKDWTVTIRRRRGGKLQENNVEIERDSASCVIQAMPTKNNFYISLNANAKQFDTYAKVLCDGLLFDHFFIPGGEAQILTMGCDHNSMIYPYRLVGASAFRVDSQGAISAERQLQGRIRVTLHKIGRGHALQMNTTSRWDLPPKLRFNQPKQTHYAGLDVPHPIDHRDHRHRRLPGDLSSLAEPFAIFTFDYSPVVLIKRNNPVPLSASPLTSKTSSSQNTRNPSGHGRKKRPRSPSTSDDDDDDDILSVRRRTIKSEAPTGADDILKNAQEPSGSAGGSAGGPRSLHSSTSMDQIPGMKEEMLRLKEEALALARLEVRFEARCEKIARKLRKTTHDPAITISDSDS